MIQTLDASLGNDGAVVSSHNGIILPSLAREPHILSGDHAFSIAKKNLVVLDVDQRLIEEQEGWSDPVSYGVL